MSPQKGSTINLTVTSASDTMSVCNYDNELVITRAPSYTSKSYSQTSAPSYYSNYTPRPTSTYDLSPSAALPAYLLSFYKSYNGLK